MDTAFFPEIISGYISNQYNLNGVKIKLGVSLSNQPTTNCR